MAKTDFSPEVKSAMEKDTKADKAKGIKEGSPQDAQIDAKVQPPGAARALLAQHAPPAGPPGGGMPPDAHHVAAATGIAHAILNNRGMR